MDYKKDMYNQIDQEDLIEICRCQDKTIKYLLISLSSLNDRIIDLMKNEHNRHKVK